MKKQIIVTTSWDDGHKLDLRIARLLKKYKIAGTFYVSRSEKEFGKNSLLKESDIKSISKYFEIGAHTINHSHLTKLTPKEAFEDIKNSKQYLEKLLGKKIYSFCYPYGDYNLKVENLVRKAGFKFARTVKRFETEVGKDKYAIPTTVHAYTHIKDLGSPKLVVKYKTNDWEVIAKKQFDYVLKKGGIFHLWGHSWEVDKFNDWEKLERVMSYIGNKKNVKYVENYKLII